MLDKKSGIEIGYEIAKMKQITNTFPSTKHPIRFVGHGSPVGLDLEYHKLALRGFYRIWQ
jgi:hypothetical protein